ncbi:MAG: Na/Pi cotransporter family protein [Candidatus Marinimicrobia bacterium]|nr:Na/Pi cotransporter family protein [Candidatus Neomarinimicrobiota bacterium]
MKKIKRTNQLLIFILVFASPVFAGGSNSDPISWTLLLMTLLGGLSLFLYGMGKMSEGMKKAAGNRMRSILSALTNNRVIGLSVGAFVTTVIQSSSATTVMLVSFVQAGLMTFTQTLGVILGADIGTTVTAQLIAFKLTDYALLMIAIGFGLTIFAKKDTQKHFGEALLGFGILFFGMKLMSDAMKPLQNYQPFIHVLYELENPMIGLLVGTLFTAIIQSSAAFTGIVIVFAQQGLITLEAGIPLILGANIGTCITAGLASIGTSREAKRVALAHVLFKIGGVVLFIFWIPAFADIIRWISPAADGSGMGTLTGATPRQIANAHTLFNVSLAFLFLPFTSLFMKSIYRILPQKAEETVLKPATWHIDESSISTPTLAINLARTEISRIVKIIGRMLEAVIHPFIEKESRQDLYYPQLSLVEGIKMREERIDFLEEKVSHFLIKITRQELSDDDANEAFAMMSVAKDLESIGDIIDKTIIPLIAKKQVLTEDFSKQGKEEIIAFHIKVSKQISRINEAISTFDIEKASNVMAKEAKYTTLESEYRIKHLKRVREELTESVSTHEIHMELMDLLKQINVYTASIAKTIVEMAPH